MPPPPYPGILEVKLPRGRIRRLPVTILSTRHPVDRDSYYLEVTGSALHLAEDLALPKREVVAMFKHFFDSTARCFATLGDVIAHGAYLFSNHPW